MHIYCETLPLPTEQVVTVNVYTGERTFELFSRLPERVRLISKEVDCGGTTEYVRVPLAEIIVNPINFGGETVSVNDAVRLKVTYHDREGNALSFETVDLVPIFYRARSHRIRATSNNAAAGMEKRK